MSEKHKGAYIAGGAAVILYLLWLAKKRGASILGGSPSSSQMAGPYGFTTPGVLTPNFAFPLAQQPQQNFSNFNVEIQNPALGYLSDKYIPLFGFVGVVK